MRSLFSFWPGCMALVLVGSWIPESARGQAIYAPYAFTNFVGQPGVEGWLDGTGNGGQLHIPHSVALDVAGNLFVADTFNHAIRKVTPEGVMTTIAGSPPNKGYGDGVGFAEAASFNSPIGVGSDAAGNLYVADNGNQTIRKVTPTGVVKLFAGRVEPRSDVYSLGATIFHLLTGSDPQDNPLLIFDFAKNPRPRQITPAIS